MHRVSIVEPTYESLPIFPLPNFVLFPNTMTRLHVFEPRYRMMVAEALATDRLIVMVGLKPGWENDYYGSPPVHEVGTLCKVVNDERLEDGRYNIFVHAIARVRVQMVRRLQPYRTASVEVVPDDELHADHLDDVMSRLRGCVRGLMTALGEHGTVLGSVVTSTRKPDILTNRLSAALASDPSTRQELLETPSVVGRAERLADLAGDLLLRASSFEPMHPDGEELMLN